MSTSTRKKRGNPPTPSSSSSSSTRATRSSARIQQQQQASTSTASAPAAASSSSSTTLTHRVAKRQKSLKMSVHNPIVIDDSDEDMLFTGSDGKDFEIDDDIQAAIRASLQDQQPSTSVSAPLSNGSNARRNPASTAEVSYGRAGWKRDFNIAKQKWGVQGDIEGYAGMIGTIRNLKFGDADDSITFILGYDDIDGREFKFNLELVFQDLTTYPASYKLVIFSLDTLPKRAETTFSRFNDVYDLEIPFLLGKVLASLQGDDEATGGFAPESDNEDGEVFMEDGIDPWAENDIGRGFEIAKGSEDDLGVGWIQLKDDFEQAKLWGYRPGLTKVSDFWNLPIDPNVLATWDDGLVDAWKSNQRFTLLIGIESYPPHLDKMRYWLGFHPNYKPPHDLMVATTRGHGLPGFNLSAPILNYLKSFSRCYKLRTTRGVNWHTADKIGMDEEESRAFFEYGRIPQNIGKDDTTDPVAKGFERNIPLVAFHWVLRRFMEAPKYCLVRIAGSKLKFLPSDRMSVTNLFASTEHTITTHPGVVDVLLSFAHCAASAGITTRMDLPLHLHIEVPIEFGIPRPQLIDDLEDAEKRRALAWLIERLPKLSEIKAHLESGGKLKSIEAPSGSIGVLRWVVGSCRAYLKETKPGEGVQAVESSTSTQGSYPHGPLGDLRQFTFVVGSPEQERDFKNEIEVAKKNSKNCKNHPSLLAFHGSGAERWHNILRTGLDFQETTNGRAYGHGVYFASDSGTSMGGYARATNVMRHNADFRLSKATALVELVNVPQTFVSSSPYYVVNNVKQIKPFLLLVQGTNTVEMTEEEEEERSTKAQAAKGHLFTHDPTLKTKPSFMGQPLAVRMPEKLKRMNFVDDDPDDQTDHEILHSSPPPIKSNKIIFKPSPESRYERLERLPPPTETCVVASKALQKEFKAVIKAQEEGSLPFWVNPDTDSLYCWLIEMHTFPPDSHLFKEMKKHKIHSIIAELRFPASFPHSPPFMRIIHPRMLPFTQGGGGNITGGGSVCNELMTSTGWNPAFCTEAVVREVMTNMTEATPPAKLDPTRWNSPYTMREAVDAYKRVALQHGWEIPRDFDRLVV